MAERLPQIARTDGAEQTPMTPREIVSELDRYIVGQRAAKRAVAIALRNRWRRRQVAEDLRDEIAPKNIIMSDPVRKVVLAYSGGLDTSVILKWLIETYGCEVVAFCADLGQGEELAPVEGKAKSTGAAEVFVEDLREEFVRDFVFPMSSSTRLNRRVFSTVSASRSLLRTVSTRGRMTIRWVGVPPCRTRNTG